MELSNVNVQTRKNTNTTKKRKKWGLFFLYLPLIILALFCFFPFYLMIIYSTHTNAELAASFVYLPGDALLSNFKSMIENVNIGRGFLNSIIISTGSTVLTLYFGGLTAYGFSKYKFRFNKQLFIFMLATMMVPGQLALIGSYKWLGMLNLLDTHAAIILPAAANTFAVFFIKQFIDGSIPDEIIESARIDGAGEWKIYNRIIMPMIVPALAAIGIFTFIGSWNNFISPLVLLFSEEKYPLPVVVAMIQGYYSTDFGLLYLGVAISVLPIIIVFSIFSKKIMGSVAIGSVKG
ncbi:carbohydrate ABC transporter permease [Lederbergia citrea]|uniref:Carbohydrate ABC transporter permease n=1 Tax=Lederbergia citrea TaxID=2833581 RepID=A0A942Z5D9_9BACI|nr:carbohydrate ABC transporter permease [Lederbergia citrea]MBS4178200.1 carbohydrate ABC transporter permease [Lederbergia citrea]MBS4204876.1 carbohydrate ABC transporter permease [Lederbergia citrea]MBS4223272.1 carbohydrate ABC transporter permease [Lederbergia citrea]